MERKQNQKLKQDLAEKYVFLGGPRQCGKTTLSRTLFPQHQTQYLNYDLTSDRRIMTSGTWNRSSSLVILDEFHKYPSWKTFLKGYYDTETRPPSLLVTGSAKLDVFRKGNDSMAGRYFYHRLLPFSVAELKDQVSAQDLFEALLACGNFPEPFLKASITYRKRWQKQYLERVIREDVTDLSNVRDLPKLQLLVDLLRARVGSPVSYASLARDLQVAPKTVKEWLSLLEQLYVIFVVTPYHNNVARSLLKEPKIYFFDCTLGFDDTSHLENLVAVSLLKHLWFLEDIQGVTAQLHYLRTKDGKEIDFLTVVDRKPKDAIEVKTSSTALNRAFFHFQKFLSIERCVQIIRHLRQPQTVDGVSLQKASHFLQQLEI